MNKFHLSGQKVLVTGARGFIGSHLCRSLIHRGAEVHAVSRTRHADDSARWWQVDLNDITLVRQLVNNVGPKVIYHLSGHVTAAPHMELTISTLESHLISTVNILVAATELGCHRLVLTGSLTEPRINSSDSTPSSPYAAAKWAATAYGRMFHKLYHTPVTIVRPFMTYGPMQNKNKLIPYVIISLLQQKSPELTSGQWEADWVYIDDVVSGLIAAAEKSQAEGCTIDLGSGLLIPAYKIVDCIIRLLGTTIKASFNVLPDRPHEEIRIADIKYARSTLDWKPTTSLKVGLSHTIAWYRDRLSSVTDQWTL